MVAHVVFDDHVLFFRSIMASVAVLENLEFVDNRVVISNHTGYGKVVQILSIDDCDFCPIVFHKIVDLELTKLI